MLIVEYSHVEVLSRDEIGYYRRDDHTLLIAVLAIFIYF